MCTTDYTKFDSLQDFVDSPVFSHWLEIHSGDDIHPCYNCELIQDEINNRISLYQSLSYRHINDFIEDLREICDYCWCPKGGGKIWWFGGCEGLRKKS